MKTPSISKKNRAGSPCPQPSGVSEPLRGARSGRGSWSNTRAAGDRGTPYARARRGRARQCHAGPVARGWNQLQPRGWTAGAMQDGLGSPRSAHGRSPWDGHCTPHPVQGCLWGPGSMGALGPGLCRVRAQGTWGLQAPLDVRATAQPLGEGLERAECAVRCMGWASYKAGLWCPQDSGA